tara:strand:+ start:139 stop:381 length:243 start_codon:yes stop_codon:yes gene_type:complete
MIRLYIIGLFILLIALAANALAYWIQCKSWYEFINGLMNTKNYWNTLSLKDGLWLFLIYPFLLGLGAALGDFIHQKFITL